MAFPFTSQCFFFLLLVLIAISPIQIQARESRFFSKVTRPESEPKPETISPVSSPAKEATPEKGYGLFGQYEKQTYQYSPTTADPTKSAAGAFEYVRPSGGDMNNNGYRHGTGEKRGMSDTRFLENGRYFHDISNEEKVEGGGKVVENNDGHESYFGNNYKGEKSYTNGGYGGMEKQGMSDTRFLENGRYFYDVESEKRNENDVVFNYNNDENVNGEEEEEDDEEDQKYDVNRAYRTGEEQGTTGTRFSDNGRYFYGGRNRNYNNGESYEAGKVGYRGYEGERYNNGEAEGGRYSGNGNGYDFRGTPNRFPKHEFDSMEEYEKYEQSKNQMNNGYGP